MAFVVNSFLTYEFTNWFVLGLGYAIMFGLTAVSILLVTRLMPHGKEHEDSGIFWHNGDHTAIAGNFTRVQAVIHHANAKEQRAGDKTVADHLHDGTFNTLHVKSKNTDSDKPHMRHRGIGNQFFHVLLHQRNQRGIDDGDNA